MSKVIHTQRYIYCEASMCKLPPGTDVSVKLTLGKQEVFKALKGLGGPV